MSAFQEEEQHLIYTRKYMELIIKEAKEKLGEVKGNVQEALSQLNDKDSSLGYTSALSNVRFLEMAIKEVDTLNKIMGKPYFARIDFQRKGQNYTDTYYLGKTSLYERETQEPIIVDWRSPIANVYYDGRLGELSYESNEGEIEGYLSLKRQFRIEDGKLIDFVDVDMMAADELLLEALSGKADTRLTEIITTIQAEQNHVIRADLNKPIIVQGAAGSGKTTIALHRLSYFIYRYRDRFEPEQLMIIAPNHMFIGYIADVLPELGVDKIRQTTYVDFVCKCIGKKVKVTKPEKKLIGLINHEIEDEQMVKWLSYFKGSLKYTKLIDRYLKDLRSELCPRDDFYLDKYRLITGKRLQYLFLKDYNYLPYYKRLEKIKNVLQTDVRQKKKVIFDKLAKKYDEQLDRALNIRNAEKRKTKVVQLMDTKDERLKQIENSIKTAVKSYMGKIKRNTLIGYYKELFADFKRFAEYGKGLLTNEQAKFMFQYNANLLAHNQVEWEDLAALFYMQHKLFGIDKQFKAKNVVIDEAQDYSYFQLYALKKGLETEMFTIVGDLAQGIHSYRGLKSWEYLRKAIFPEANYVTLQKSYRTTIEIMNVANEILSLMKEDLPRVEPVVRHGKKPTYIEYNSTLDLVEIMNDAIGKAKAAGYRSIAIIGKTDHECKKIRKLLTDKSKPPIQLLKENEEIKSDHIVIVPSYLAKGLEFDAVLIVVMDETYTRDELDLKLLYIAMTRPMHQLYLIGQNKQDMLLEGIRGIEIE